MSWLSEDRSNKLDKMQKIPFFVINLDTRKDRLERIQKECQREGVNFLRFRGLTSEEVDDSKNLCWDVVLNKEKAINLAESIFKIYS